MASDYDDELWETVPDDRRRPVPDHLRDFVRGLPPVREALDLGCGDGRLSAELAAQQLIAADVSPVALARASRRLPDARLLELEPDAPLPLGDGTVDLVLCAETVEHVRDVQRFLSEIRRVLRPGGTLALSTPAHGRLTALRVALTGWDRVLDPLSPHLRHFSRASLRAVLQEMAFTETSIVRRGGSLLATAKR
jgi:SAM-dependent methyltransferase